jgi:hypothetical protein
LGGEVVSEDGVGRGELHRRVGRVVNGHIVLCRSLEMCIQQEWSFIELFIPGME